MHTICFKCGASKGSINESCRRCSFKPTSIGELARARILSEPYCFTTPSGLSFETGRSPEELAKISNEIRRGVAYDFQHQELENVKKVIRNMESYSGFDLIKDLGKLFGPAIGLLALILLVLWLL